MSLLKKITNLVTPEPEEPSKTPLPEVPLPSGNAVTYHLVLS